MSSRWLEEGQSVIWLDSMNNITVVEGHHKFKTVKDEEGNPKKFLLKEWKPLNWQAHEITEDGEIKQELQAAQIGMYV